MMPMEAVNGSSSALFDTLQTQNISVDHNNKSSPCSVLILQKLADFHYEILESVALRFPLPWTDLGCGDAGISASDPIQVDYLLRFAFEKTREIEKMEAWGWKHYFEQHLQGRIRKRIKSDGKFIQFRSIVGKTAEDARQIDWKAYAAQIEASCDVAEGWSRKWMEKDPQSHFCVLHEKHVDMTPECAPRVCYLNPQFHPNCWFVPADYPPFPPPEPVTANSRLNICIPDVFFKNASALIQSMLTVRPPNVTIVINGRHVQTPRAFRKAGLFDYVDARGNLRDYHSFQKSVAQCHAMIPLVEPVGRAARYFLGNSSDEMGKLPSSVAQLIGNRIPSVLHTAVVAIYRKELTAPYFEYDDSDSFLVAFVSLLEALRLGDR